MSVSPWSSRWREVENALEEHTGTIIGQHSVANLLIIEDWGLDLQLWADEGELHEGKFGATLQVPGLHLNICFVDPEGLARLNVGDEKSELAIKVKE